MPADITLRRNEAEMAFCTSPREQSHPSLFAQSPPPRPAQWANSPGDMRVLRRFTQRQLTRDWRVKTLVPVIIANVVAFVALYALMYHFAASNLIETHRRSAVTLLNDVELNFEDAMLEHTAPTVSRRFARRAKAHGLALLNLYDPQGRPFITVNPRVSAAEISQARQVLSAPSSGLAWTLGDDNVVTFSRALANRERCHACHEAHLQRLAVLQLGFDLTDAIALARQNVRQKFAFAGIAWIGVLALLFWTGRIVIGRPLEEIEKTIGEGSKNPKDRGDLAALAHRVHLRIWNLIDEQKRREENVARQLVRAKQLAALGELAAGLTHEIKNPLAGVMSALELLRSEGDVVSLQNVEVYDQVINELRRVTSTLDSLLRLARPQVPQRVDVDMARVVRELSSLFSARFRRQGITFEVEIPETPPVLSLDPALMAQLVVNLLNNSMQATDRGGSVKVLIAPFPRRDGVVLAVSDSGHGIPAEQLERVFDPFFTTKEEGTGLGLAICRQIVEQHGGTITLESELGNGTRVVVLLPDSNPKERVSDVAVAAG